MTRTLSDAGPPRKTELPAGGDSARAQKQNECHECAEYDEPRSIREVDPNSEVDAVLRITEERVESADGERADDRAEEAVDAADDEHRESQERQLQVDL